MKRNNANIGKEPFGQDNSRDVVDAFRPRDNMDVTRMSYDANSVMTDKERESAKNYGDAYKADKHDEQNARRVAIGGNSIAPQDNKPSAEPTVKNGYQEWIDTLAKEKQQSDDERKNIDALNPESFENQRRQRRNRLFASIGDGLSSMAKMYFAAKGAPVAQSEAPSLSASVANQKLNDANRYYTLLSKWRADRNDLIKAQADMQYKQDNLRRQNDRLNFEREREERLKAKQKLDDAYRTKLLDLREKGLDQGAAKLELDDWYKRESLKIARYNADTRRIAANKSGGETVTVTEEPLINPHSGEILREGDKSDGKPLTKTTTKTTSRKGNNGK